MAKKAARHWGEALRAGAAKRDPKRAPLDVFVGGGVAIGEGLEPLRDAGRPMTALYVGGMGARDKNFYNDVFASCGYAKEAKLIQDLYLAGRKKEAEAAVPAAFIEETTLIGPPGFVRDRLAELKASGVTSLNVGLIGETIDDRLRTLAELRALVDSL